jgi:multidrug efflux pump subunit AcrA (membrane-fusion protein)
LLAVPPEALTTRDGRSVVYIVRDDRTVEASVTPGAKVGDLTTVDGDVKSGDKVVLKPAPDLRSGALVKIAQK